MVGALLGALVVAGGLALWSRAHDASSAERLATPSADQCTDSRMLDPRQRAVCDGVWLRPARRGFVPQGLVVRGRTAIVSGYQQASFGHRFCQLLVADVATGRTRVQLRRLTGTLDRAPILCRHGGGLAVGPEGLWVAESTRLWLLDPEALAGGDPALRVWRIEQPVRGSALVRRPGEVGLVGWSDRRGRQVHWVPIERLTADGVDVIGVDAGPGVAVPSAHRGIPGRVQGATWGRGGLWLARSTSFCGVLVRPEGTALRFLPGAEGIDFAGGRLWLVSESGSGAYQRERQGRPVIPTLLSVDPDDLDPDTEPPCGWEQPRNEGKVR